MATLNNTVNSTSLFAAIGSPTLGASDVLRVAGGENENNYTTALSAMSTAIAEAHFYRTFTGMIGNRLSPLTVQAVIMSVAFKGPSAAMAGIGSGTVTRFTWMPELGSEGQLSNYTMTDLHVLTAGKLTLLEDCVVANGIVAPGAHLVAQSATAMTSLTVSGVAEIHRDLGTLTVEAGGNAMCMDSTVTPTAINISNGRVRVQGDTSLSIGAKSVIDLSYATQDLTLTYSSITGPFTIIETQSDLSYTAPPAWAVDAGLVTFVPASAAA